MVVIVTTIFFVTKSSLAFHSLTNQHGIWIVRHNLKSKASIDRVVDNLVNMNINHAYIQIRGRGYTYYNSIIEPKEPNIPNDFDPLDYFIKKAIKHDIKVHAWINTYLLWTNPSDPTNKNHLYFQHPDWLEIANIKNSQNGVRQIYLSPHLMRVNLYLLSLVEEIIDKYPIDGIHLDYVRYYNKNSGHHPQGVQKFLALNGGNSEHILQSEEWVKYKSSKIDELIQDVSDLIKIQSRPITFSAAVKPNPKNAYYSYGQNWSKWIKERWIDHVVLMNYADNINVFTENLSIVQTDIGIEKVYCGIGLWNKSKDIIIDQMIESKKRGFNNIVLFSYDTIIENQWIQ